MILSLCVDGIDLNYHVLLPVKCGWLSATPVYIVQFACLEHSQLAEAHFFCPDRKSVV